MRPHGALARQAAAPSLTGQHSLWVLALCLLLAQVMISLATPSLTAFWLALSHVNVIQLGAVCLLAHLCLQLEPDGPQRDVRWRHGLYMLLTLVMALLSATLMVLGLLVCWFVEWSQHRFQAPLRGRTALLAGALAVNMLIAPFIFQAFGEAILRWDALIVFKTSAWLDPSAVLLETAVRRGKFGVVLVGACSSFNALSLASLAYVAYVIWRQRTPNRLDFAWLLVMSALMIGFNVARIVVSGASREAYDFWHDSPWGVALITLALHVLLLGASAIGERLCRR